VQQLKKQLKIQTHTPIVALVIVIVCAVSQLTASSHTEHAISKQASSTPADAKVYFGLKVAVGQKFGNVFAKIVSYQGGGIDEYARRIGGSAHYEVLDATPERPRFLLRDRYDGLASSSTTMESRDSGATYCSVDTGKCQAYLDDSGVAFDAFLWGHPSGPIVPGMTWKVELPVPWELGPPGTQLISVVQTDSANHEVMLKREGSGDGVFANDQKQIKVKKDGKEYTVDVTPGLAHWVGYTIFQNGITVSDELVVTRSLKISSKEFGSADISERQFTLLNLAPPDLL
jgi:hypothetical protein